MAKKNNNISINALEKYCKAVSPTTKTLTFSFGEDGEIACEVKCRLSLEDTLRFVEDVVKATIMTDDVMVVPVAKEYVIGRNVLTYYANFTMPTDTNKAYDLVMASTEIITQILNEIDGHQFLMIQQAIAERVEFEKQKMIAGQETQIKQLTDKISDMASQMENIFDGVDGNQMADFITGMAKVANEKTITSQDLAAELVKQGISK